MYTNHQIALTRKILYVIMFTTVFVVLFYGGLFSSAHAQEAWTATPISTEVSSTHLFASTDKRLVIPTGTLIPYETSINIKNDIYGFSVSYPSHWLYYESNYTGYSNTYTFTNNGLGVITIYVKKGQGETGNSDSKIIQATLKHYVAGHDPASDKIGFSYGGSLFEIDAFTDSDNFNDVSDFLSSFKFGPTNSTLVINPPITLPQSRLSSFPQCPAENVSGFPTWGSVLVSSGSWNGVDVYSNGGDANNACPGTYGYNYQCVELARRFFSNKWGYWWPSVSYASQMFDTHPGDTIAIPNGGSPGPVWGDALVFGGGVAGHVAIVTSVSNGRVYFVEQNWGFAGQYTGRGSLAINSSNTIETRGSYYVRGWIHSPKNDSNCYSLSVNHTGGGTAYASPNSTSCGSYKFPAGTTVQLVATPYAGWHFAYWTGGPSGGATTNFTVNNNSTVNAVFVEDGVIPTPSPEPTPIPSGWNQTFYSDNNLGSQCGTRNETDVYIFRDSDVGWSPPSGCPGVESPWSVRMERGDAYFQGGNYEFGMFYDDNARLYMDGVLIVDGWIATQHYESHYVTQGNHNLRLEYKNNAGHAIVQLWWRGPGALPGNNQTQDPNQWWVNYWGNQSQWQDSVGQQNEGSGSIDHNWGGGGPGFGIPSDHFSIKYERTVGFECGTYRFHIRSDDGSRLWIDDVKVGALDHWATNVWDSAADVFLPAGNHELKVDYFEDGGDANLHFDWSKISNCVPATPSNLQWSSTSPYSITISWDDISNEDGYRIYRWDGDTASFVYLDTVGVNQTSYTETRATCGWDQFYEVSAYNSDGESDHTGWVHGITEACSLPDLSITNFSYSPSTIYANNDIWVTVEIINSSDMIADPFNIMVYIENHYFYLYQTEGLNANSSNSWLLKIPEGAVSAGSYEVWVMADYGSTVLESNEDNNMAGPFPLEIYPTQNPPDHDDFDSPRIIYPLPYTDVVDVSDATSAADDPHIPSNCVLMAGVSSVWYKYIPSHNTKLSIDTFGSNYDTYIAVWTGSRGNLVLVDCNDDASSTLQSALQVNVMAGTTYYIEVAKYNGIFCVFCTRIMEIVPGKLPRIGEEGSLMPLLEEKTSTENTKPISELRTQSVRILNFHVVELTQKVAFQSIAAQDGWILESSENSIKGGTLNATDTTFRLGDEAGDKQYRSILSFNTASLIDNAVITKVTLKIRVYGALVGNNNPFSWVYGLKVDVCNGIFGTTGALQLGDFNFNNTTNCKLLAVTFGSTPTSGWYSANLGSAAWSRINKSGLTQFRLRFYKDDNDDGIADYWRFISGNYGTVSARPTLIIEYYVP